MARTPARILNHGLNRGLKYGLKYGLNRAQTS
jgi:hypothetical protein